MQCVQPPRRAGLIALVVGLLVVGGRVEAQDSAEAHKAWMNEAAEAQEDFRYAVVDKNAKLAAEAMGKLEALMQRTETYWTAKKATDGVALAREARVLAAQAAEAARKPDLVAAAEPFAKMSATCNTCHELHLEKR